MTHDSSDHEVYRKKQLAINLGLLENHFLEFPCHDCMEKHLLLIEGLASEGVEQTGEEVYSRTKKWAERTLKAINAGTTETELTELASAARDLRKQVQVNAHLTEKEIEISLQHDTENPVVVSHA
jgi:hypothetical protein